MSKKEVEAEAETEMKNESIEAVFNSGLLHTTFDRQGLSCRPRSLHHRSGTEVFCKWAGMEFVAEKSLGKKADWGAGFSAF